jgi:hypothetical protein
VTPEFAARLERARRVLARGRPDPPVHLRDQAHAAESEATDQLVAFRTLANLIAPTRGWRQSTLTEGHAERMTYLYACLLSVEPCAHLRDHPAPQVAHAVLPVHRALCLRCYSPSVLASAPRDELDRCDVCGARGVRRFTPFQAQYGNALIGGDACRACARVLLSGKVRR